jgi:hypothetical protein
LRIVESIWLIESDGLESEEKKISARFDQISRRLIGKKPAEQVSWIIRTINGVFASSRGRTAFSALDFVVISSGM